MGRSLRSTFCVVAMALVGVAAGAPGSSAIRLTSAPASTWETTRSRVDLTGTVNTRSPVRVVRWVDQFGHGGTGSSRYLDSNTVAWSLPQIPLRPGVNLLTVSAVDEANRSVTLNLAIRRTPSAADPESLPVRTGTWRNHSIAFRWKDGRAVLEGDMWLSAPLSATVAGAQPAPGAARTIVANGLDLDYQSRLWPKTAGIARIPYIITANGNDTTTLSAAIAQFNAQFSGLIEFDARNGDANYVNISVAGGGGEGFSDVGMIGGEQSLTCGSACPIVTWLHEMGHTMGLLHEHQRPDRASYLSIDLANADLPNVPGNFTLFAYDDQSSGLFDYASVMEYGAFDFSKAGQPVIESIPAGIPLSNDAGYSAGDVDQVERLYGAAPSQVTITTNPTGLAIVVDGTAYVAPQRFNWALGSTHTIAAGADPQTTTPGDGSTYRFGNWNDLGARSHTINVTAGGGALTAPATVPAVTVYSANFVRLQPFATLTPAVYPAGAGSLAISPTPISAYGGTFFVDRTLVTLTVTPNAGSGYNFYDWFNLPLPPSDNPHQFYIQAPTTAAQAVFVPDAVTLIGESLSGANAWNPLIGAYVDSNYTILPSAFAATYDSGWTSGTVHSVSAPQTQSPVTTNVFYNFNAWSDGGGINHNVTQPASGTQAITASFTPYYATYTLPAPLGAQNSACYGGVTTTPAGTAYASNSAFLFYPEGASVTTAATPNPLYPGLQFSGWSGSLTGNSNPLTATIHDQFVPVGNFNVSATPIAVATLNPPSAPAGTAALDLTVDGSGFVNGSTNTYWNGSYRASTIVNSGELVLHLLAGDLVAPGGQDVYVGNYVTNSANSTCGVGAESSFLVTGPGPATAVPNPTSLTFPAQLVGTKSAPKTVTLTNTGATALAVAVITDVGGTPTSFPLTTTCAASLVAGASCTVSVVFSPGGAGARFSTLTLTDSAGKQAVPLSGTGVLPAVKFSPTALAFPAQVEKTKSAPQTLTVTNIGASTLSITGLADVGGTPTSFPFTTTCGSSLAAAASCTVNIVFSPGGVGNRATTLTLTDSAGTQTVPLTGTGVAPSVQLSPTTLSFPAQVEKTKSAPQTLTVTNIGASTLSITGLADVGGTPTSFPFTTTCGSSLAAAASCTVNVVFSPGGVGNRATTLTLTDSAGTQTVPLTGTGVAP